MSQFSGPQGRGAMKKRRDQKKIESEVRRATAILSVHPDGFCNCKSKKSERDVGHHTSFEVTPDKKLLKEIFGIEMHDNDDVSTNGNTMYAGIDF